MSTMDINAPDPERTVTDGWDFWLKCDRKDCDLHVVRPGKVQCSRRPCEQVGPA